LTGAFVWKDHILSTLSGSSWHHGCTQKAWWLPPVWTTLSFFLQQCWRNWNAHHWKAL